MLIPVGGKSVQIVSELKPERALLPSRESLDICYEKTKTLELASKLEVPIPRTFVVRSMEDLASCDIPCPCVIKSSCETVYKRVFYARTDLERDMYTEQVLDLAGKTGHGVLVQEYIRGSGHGFFALFDRGRPVRVFMHERLREYPVTGGASTAARSYYNPQLKEYGLRLLSKLGWNGVSMVEFKHDSARDRFVLMEINAKFWGSVELALSAGMNFAADIVSVFRGEHLEYSEEYNRKRHFYWPLNGDLMHLLEVHSLNKIRDYRAKEARTNLGHSFHVDLWGMLVFIKSMLLTRRFRNAKKAIEYRSASYYRGIIHVHSKYSYDSWRSSRSILRAACGAKLDFVLLTDHGTIKGSQMLQEKAARARIPLLVPVAAEYKTEYGDIIAAFISHEVQARRWDDFVKEVRQQGGLLLLPHPFSHHCNLARIVQDVDLIETYNGRLSALLNEKARVLSEKIGKPGYAASDSHVGSNILSVVIEVKKNEDLRTSLLQGTLRCITCRQTRPRDLKLSQIIKALKGMDIQRVLWLMVTPMVRVPYNAIRALFSRNPRVKKTIKAAEPWERIRQ